MPPSRFLLDQQIRLTCPHCNGHVYVSIPYPYLLSERDRLRREGVEEHRRICTKAPPEAQRVYKIEYLR